ncbi:hypothetical protein BDV36DRAFT_168973 [Aspergillus pseudocaelatus]|uniref:Secreted protein n=1 Tax=Aspergillus pseudocaelatus TaxID=1825620 RepID=A0ABQ6WLA9_9EURO|nr:hypothetical protein BDV36DRAFT_168973 [Aspergillus pseudocaelatus]
MRSAVQIRVGAYLMSIIFCSSYSFFAVVVVVDNHQSCWMLLGVISGYHPSHGLGPMPACFRLHSCSGSHGNHYVPVRTILRCPPEHIFCKKSLQWVP